MLVYCLITSRLCTHCDIAKLSREEDYPDHLEHHRDDNKYVEGEGDDERLDGAEMSAVDSQDMRKRDKESAGHKCRANNSAKLVEKEEQSVVSSAVKEYAAGESDYFERNAGREG